ncbi:ATP-dependent DNA helicase RecQ-like [Antedon mediterranea]|uniref:ATP-dependent DNA helicase RecQ-like n=1 Tax=Antedon mediterranea TaxID=105859 RepID=UPI003AF8A63B
MEDVKISIASVTQLFGYENAKTHQCKVLEEIIRGNDVLLCSPTGSGKSFCYSALPFVLEHLSTGIAAPTCNIVLVITPLLSLMQEQTKSLNQKKLNATYIGKTGDDNDLRSGKFNIVFSSPETVLTTHRQMLLSNPYQKSVKAVFVDESHCIEKWGHTVGGESVPFREHYARIGELRSILPMSVPMIALTATASKKTRATIINDLHMKVPVLVDLGVNKPNIRYTVIKTKQGFRDVDALFSIFVPIIEELKIKKIEASRTIVFCRRRSHCRDLYEMFMTALGVEAYDATCKHVDDRGRFVAMFQQGTDVDVKESVMSSFADPNGVIRVLFSTIAFGMGMDVKGLQTVIHLGPPADLDDYLQETGRAGRDSLKQSFAILLKYSHSTSRTSESMKEYISGNKCRRKTLMINSFLLLYLLILKKKSFYDPKFNRNASFFNRFFLYYK